MTWLEWIVGAVMIGLLCVTCGTEVQEFRRECDSEEPES